MGLFYNFYKKIIIIKKKVGLHGNNKGNLKLYWHAVHEKQLEDVQALRGTGGIQSWRMILRGFVIMRDSLQITHAVLYKSLKPPLISLCFGIKIGNEGNDSLKHVK